MAQSTSCTGSLGVPAASAAAVKTLGTQPASVNLALNPGHTYLIEVAERDNDALVEVLGSEGEVLTESDQPERRTGTRRALVTAPSTGASHRASDRQGARERRRALRPCVPSISPACDARPDCLAVMKALAAADADYAAGQAISRGLSSSRAANARDLYVHAMEEYSSPQEVLAADGDPSFAGKQSWRSRR